MLDTNPGLVTYLENRACLYFVGNLLIEKLKNLNVNSYQFFPILI